MVWPGLLPEGENENSFVPDFKEFKALKQKVLGEGVSSHPTGRLVVHNAIAGKQTACRPHQIEPTRINTFFHLKS